MRLADGTHACRLGRRPKYAYDTLDEAWLRAWILFAFDGRLLTPYQCRTRKLYYWHRTRIPHPNPWCFSPPYYEKSQLRRLDKDDGKDCRRWHLTRSTQHMLNP